MTAQCLAIEEYQAKPAPELSMSAKPFKRRKSLTRIFSSASRKSCPPPPVLPQACIPPTPPLPVALMEKKAKMPSATLPMPFDFKLGDDKSPVSPEAAEDSVGLGIVEARVEQQPLHEKRKMSVRHSSLRRTMRKDPMPAQDKERPRTASVDHARFQASSTFPLRESGSIRTNLRTTSIDTFLPRRRSSSVAEHKTEDPPALPQLSRPTTSGDICPSPKTAGTPSQCVRRAVNDSVVTPSQDAYAPPPSPQRPWPATYGDAEVRSSFRSALTMVSSQTNTTTSTTRSSVLTKDTSITEMTIDPHSRPGSKTDDGIMTVDEAIDMYVAGFTDSVEEKPGESEKICLSEEERRRSMRIAEALSDNMGSPIAPRPSMGSLSGPNTSSLRRPSVATSLPASSLPLTGNRDQYGFLKVNHYITRAQYDAWSADYLPIQDRRTSKWAAYMRESGLSTHHPKSFPPRSAKMQRYIRKGIPPAWRGAAWFHYAGGNTYLSRHPQLYNNLVHLSESNLQENEKESIERDLHRTFPDNIRFKPEPHPMVTADKDNDALLLDSLRRVLRAFALHSPKIGYCQSLNFIAALLLLFLPEERAFWMLHIITTVYLPGTHEVSLEGANVDLWVSTVLLKNTLPGVWAKVGAAGAVNEVDGRATLPPISLCTTSWFMSLYIGTLPIETVLRVWDVLFYEGSRTLFRVALAIFKIGEQRIKSVNESMELFQVVQGLPRGMIDAGKFMEVVNKKGGVGGDWVERRRGERRIWLARERDKKIMRGDVPSSEVTENDEMYKEVVARKANIWRRKRL
ncbi:MAG: hypothetical protein Q9163_004611 [Psora crenata]